jgi:hypothetical protein
MADVQSHREIQQESFNEQAPLTPDAPKPMERGELGPNPFEESWTHEHVLKPQDDDSPGDIEPAAEIPANDEDVVVTQPDDQDVDSQVAAATDEAPVAPPNPEVELLRQQNAELAARLERLEAGPEAAEPEVEQGVSWDNMNLPPLPDELEDYADPIDKRVIAIANHAINQMYANAERQAAQQQAQATQQSLKTQIQDMVADPAYADYATYYPRMKEIAQSAPALLQQPNGLKAIYVAAKGEVPAATPVSTGNGADDSYARGVKAGMAKVQGKRASAVDSPGPVTADTRVLPTGGRTLEQALDQEFQNAVARARQR